MRGQIVHTVTIPAGGAPDERGAVPFRSTKSSPGYGEYYPAYVSLERLDGIYVHGVNASVHVKSFHGRHVIVEVAAPFEGDAAAPIAAFKDALHMEADRAARRYGDISLREEYTFYGISDYDDGDRLITENRLLIAQLLKDETAGLTDDEIETTLASSLRYDRDDFTVIEWDGALILDKSEEFEDTITLIELANIQLVAYRELDARLTSHISGIRGMGEIRAPNIFRLSRTLRAIMRARAESLYHLDAIGDALKLYGDWYDARVYSLAARKLYLDKWRQTVEDKLALLEKIFEMVSALQGEMYNIGLEFSIVALIVLEIGLALWGVK